MRQLMLSLCLALTTHIGIGGGWNEVHPCIKYEQDQWTVGAFLNSEDSASLYLSYTWGDKIFLEAGVVTGYAYSPVLPMLRAGVKVREDISFFVIPAYDVPSERIGFVLGIKFEL